MRRVLISAVGLLLLGVLTVCVAGAAAKDVTVCDSGTTLTGVIDGDVSAGPGCDLSAVTLVDGNVKVNPGGSLMIAVGSTITITGNVESKDATSIDIEGGSIGHDVKIEGTTATEPGEMTFIGYGTVEGNVDLHKNTAYVQVLSLTVGGDVKVHDNRGSNSDGFGLVEVAQSTIEGKVDVSKNSLTGFDLNFVNVANGDLANGSIGGDLKVRDNTVAGGFVNWVQTYFNDVDGKAEVKDNTAEDGDDNEVLTYQNNVNGDLDVSDNRARGGSTNVVDVSGNAVVKDLDCKGNRPKATADQTGPNNAHKKKGECKDL